MNNPLKEYIKKVQEYVRLVEDMYVDSFSVKVVLDKYLHGLDYRAKNELDMGIGISNTNNGFKSLKENKERLLNEIKKEY